MLTFRYTGADGAMTAHEILTSGMVEKKVKLEFSSDWENLRKTAVFKSGTVTKDRVNVTDFTTIPTEVLVNVGDYLYVGIYGVSEDGSRITPTIYARGPKIREGADPSGDESTEPTLPVWAQLDQRVKNLEENETDSGSSDSSQNPTVAAAAIDYDQSVKAINHRGYSTTAPENTIPAYILSKEKGFKYVETDVSFTSDGVPVLLHDASIDRTSTGSGNISGMTYAEASKYDYGSWMSEEYKGTRIPTFEEFIKLCKNLMLHPYIELKSNGSYTEAQIKGLVEMVNQYGLNGKVTWISFAAVYLEYVKKADPKARLGYLSSADVTADIITTVQNLQADGNEVFLDLAYYRVTDDAVALCVNAGIPLEVWTVDSNNWITGMNPYITGVTSNDVIAGKVLYKSSLDYKYSTDLDDGSTEEAALLSISATYSGGDVTAGTSVNNLTGIVVTAHYSDGSTKTVSGYTLSGTITEGSNTITVTYQDKVTTFTVTGVASGGDEGGDTGEESKGALVYNWDLTQSLTDTVIGVALETSGTAVTQDGNGLTITNASSGARIPADVPLQSGDIVEIDIANMAHVDTSGHSRLVILRQVGGGNQEQHGVIYRSTGAWDIYMNGWTGTTTVTDPNAFANKTMKIEMLDKGCNVYVDDQLVTYTQNALDGTFKLGCSSNAYYNVTFTGLRVYRPA